MSKDHTIHASIDGVVAFGKKNYVRFDGRKYLKTFVSVLTYEEVALQAKDAATSAPKAEKKTEKKSKKEAAPKKAVAKKVSPKKAEPKKQVVKATAVKSGNDDLTKIEGIGPKIQEVFYAA
jgi:predicted flap endonuclease-1-like 5' DNA nuclease